MRLLALLLLSFSANAQYMTTSMLSTALDGTPTQRSAAEGYILAVYDAGKGVTHCTKSDPDPDKLVEWARLPIRENPNMQAATILTKSYSKMWPCAKKGYL